MNDTIISTFMSALCSGGLTWLFTIRYARKQAEADSMKSVQEIYQKLVEDLKTEREELKAEIDKLKVTVENNTRDINAMRPKLCGKVSCSIRIPIQ